MNFSQPNQKAFQVKSFEPRFRQGNPNPSTLSPFSPTSFRVSHFASNIFFNNRQIAQI
jgi:hypothetical protein